MAIRNPRKFKLELAKKPRRKKKYVKIVFSEKCNYCGKALPICRVRNMTAYMLAKERGFPVALSSEGIPLFFCSQDCKKEFESGIPFEVPF